MDFSLLLCIYSQILLNICYVIWFFFFFKQKTAYEMRISDWSSDVCSSDLAIGAIGGGIRGYELGVVAGALLFAAPALGMGPALTGWVVSSALLGSLFGALGAGPAADRIGRRQIIGVAAFIFSLGIVGAALSPDVATLIPSRVVLGVAVGIAPALIPAYIRA